MPGKTGMENLQAAESKRALSLAVLLAGFLASGADVRDYGVAGDGVTDDTATMRAAIQGIGSSSPIFLPPGTYLLSEPMRLLSNCQVRGTPATIIRKRVPYCHVFVNQAASTHGTNWDHDISIADLTIDVNGNESPAGQAEMTAWGNIHFGYCRNVEVRNVTMINGDVTCAGIHLQAVTNATISHYRLVNRKDGVDIASGCQNITLTDSWICTGDDGVCLIPADDTRFRFRTDDVRDITITNVVFGHTTSIGGNIAVVLGSWTDWKPGNIYQIGDCAINAGNIYVQVNNVTNAALVPPTHTTYIEVQGSDGLRWRWLQTGTNRTSNVRHVSVYAVRSDRQGWLFHVRGADAPGYMHTVYPGTDGMAGIYDVTVQTDTLRLRDFQISRGLASYILLWSGLPD